MSSTNSTTFAVASLLDQLCEAHDAAVAKLAASDAPNADAWARAIDRAWGYILTVDTLAYDAASHTLLVESATEAGRSYRANGECQCRAYTHSTAQVCWHRAAARIVSRALELVEAQAEARAQAELTDLAAELLEAAQADGVEWYGERDAIGEARTKLYELTAYAEAWDAAALAQRQEAQVARIVVARRQLAAAA
jgi:hypothetical protein